MRTRAITKKYKYHSIISTMPWHVIKVYPLSNYTFAVEFIDGTQGLVNIKNLILSKRKTIFSPLKDKEKFEQLYIHDGIVMWPNKVDLAPDAMYEEVKNNIVYIAKWKV